MCHNSAVLLLTVCSRPLQLGTVVCSSMWQGIRPLLIFIQLSKSFDPDSLRLTLKADSDPEFVIRDLDLP